MHRSGSWQQLFQDLEPRTDSVVLDLKVRLHASQYRLHVTPVFDCKLSHIRFPYSGYFSTKNHLLKVPGSYGNTPITLPKLGADQLPVPVL